MPRNEGGPFMLILLVMSNVHILMHLDLVVRDGNRRVKCVAYREILLYSI